MTPTKAYYLALEEEQIAALRVILNQIDNILCALPTTRNKRKRQQLLESLQMQDHLTSIVLPHLRDTCRKIEEEDRRPYLKYLRRYYP